MNETEDTPRHEGTPARATRLNRKEALSLLGGAGVALLATAAPGCGSGGYVATLTVGVAAG